MFGLNNTLIKKLFLNLVIFFFIIIVFLNQIHLHLNKNFFFEKTENNYILKSNDLIKKEFSEYLIAERNYSALDRNCVVTGDFTDRHKVRWVKAFFLKNFFSISGELNEKLPYYNNILLHGLLIFLSLSILKKTFNLKEKHIFLFLLYYTFIFQNYLSEYSYSIFEMFFLCLSLYASKERKFLLFLASVTLAVLNRESGFIILLSWLIFNNDFKKLIISFVIIALFLIFINLDIAKCIFKPEFFIPLKNQTGQIDIFDFAKINLISQIKLIVLNFLLPFGLAFNYLYATKNKNKILIGIIFIYLVVFIIATPLHHVSIRLLILPLIFTSIYFFNKEKVKN